jgi:hypothetical protein
MNPFPTISTQDRLFAKIRLQVENQLLTESNWGDYWVDPTLFFPSTEIHLFENEDYQEPWTEEVPILMWHEGLGGQFVIRACAGPLPHLDFGPLSQAGKGNQLESGPVWERDEWIFLPGNIVRKIRHLERGATTVVQFQTSRGGVFGSYELRPAPEPFSSGWTPRIDLMFHSRFDLLHADPRGVFDLARRDTWIIGDMDPWIILDRDTRKILKVSGAPEGARWLDRFRPQWRSVFAYWGDPNLDLPGEDP